MKLACPQRRVSTVSFAVRAPGKARGTRSRLLSIDPGLNGTGCVLWVKARPIAAKVFHPLASQVKLDLSESDALVRRARNLATQIERWRADYMPVAGALTTVIEFPEHHESLKGRTARVTGSIDRLSFLIGVMAGGFPDHWQILLPRVRDWKGQLPKDIVAKRMIARFGANTVVKLNIRSHAWDALGIGEWAWRQPWMSV